LETFMKLRLGLSALTLAALAACGGGDSTTPAPSFETTRIIAFGDSLTDGGAYSRANSLILQSQAGVPKAAADLVGKFTNSPGDVWVEVLAKKLGRTITPERFEVGAASWSATAASSTTARTRC
jgi:phospholipase/lecithinase/hemolysin